MKAMVFAAGVGSRLKELTLNRPKCLMEVNGVCLLEFVIHRLKAVGVSEVMINVHHHHTQVIEFVKSKGSFGISVSFSRETELLDTGGGLKKVAPFFSNEAAFFIHNSDIYSEVALQDVLAAHRATNALATLAVMERASSRGLYFSPEGQLCGWTNELNTSPQKEWQLLAFSGISIASAEIFNFMPSDSSFSLITPFLSAARSNKPVLAHRIDGALWSDIGTPDNLTALRTLVEAKKDS